MATETVEILNYPMETLAVNEREVFKRKMAEVINETTPRRRKENLIKCFIKLLNDSYLMWYAGGH